jgi:polysaccharide pyruvyl transferase WcaK-like protein
MIRARSAFVLNFTANTYHWGCYGTAIEVYQSLLERGYYPSYASVHVTHAFSPAPATWEEMNDPRFMREACDANPLLATSLRESDVIVVNGEGTLHRDHPAPRNLLFLMHLARRHFGKPVHLINHSFYPSGSCGESSGTDPMYRSVAADLTRVVPRESYSLGILRRLGVDAVQGFDCLPRFIARHQASLTADEAFRHTLLLSGGVNMTPHWARQLGRVIESCRQPGQRVVYISGAKSQPAREDRAIHALMSGEISNLEFYEAASMSAWLNAIAGAQGLVSARFHHTLAAAMLGTPAVVFPSNTPKLDAVCDMLQLDAPLAFDDPRVDERLADSLASIQAGRGRVISAAARQHILDLAGANFTGL